jgi:RimJ/RimL family protein N-acetyltransferase
MNPTWSVQTGRLLLQPVWGGDLPELQALKADPRVFAVMLGGVRSPAQTVEELADDIVFWGRHGFGMWTVRERGDGKFLGLVGILERHDGRGMALRFALTPDGQGRGFGAEAAFGALRFGHERAGLSRIVAVAREDNFASRTVLGAIGMRPYDSFNRGGTRMLVYESVRESGHTSGPRPQAGGAGTGRFDGGLG